MSLAKDFTAAGSFSRWWRRFGLMRKSATISSVCQYLLIVAVFRRYVYMVMGRMVFNFLPGAHVYKIKAWHLGMIFVLLDTVAFFIQTGGLAMVGSGKTLSGQLRGIHICKTPSRVTK